MHKQLAPLYKPQKVYSEPALLKKMTAKELYGHNEKEFRARKQEMDEVQLLEQQTWDKHIPKVIFSRMAGKKLIDKVIEEN